MPDLEDFFECSIPPTLWHYTSVDALRGILESGTVWATEVHFTKDTTEFVHTKSVAIDYLEKLPPPPNHAAAVARSSALKSVHYAFDKGALSTEVSQVFVASFSSAFDLKSQWYEFADAGRGVSIGFDLRGILPPVALQIAVTMAPCVYHDKDKYELVASALSTYIEKTEYLLNWSVDHVAIASGMVEWAASGTQLSVNEFLMQKS